MLALPSGCARREPCADLNRFADPGIVIASEDERCRAILDFAALTEERYGLGFKEWLAVVYAQKVVLFLDIFQALTVPGPPDESWQPASFPREPAEVPCGKGEEVSEGWWRASVLSRVIRSRPAKMYVSLGLEINGDVATIRVYQDFDCDGEIGVNELTARFRTGLGPTHGGWELVKPTVIANMEE